MPPLVALLNSQQFFPVLVPVIPPRVMTAPIGLIPNIQAVSLVVSPKPLDIARSAASSLEIGDGTTIAAVLNCRGAPLITGASQLQPLKQRHIKVLAIIF